MYSFMINTFSVQICLGMEVRSLFLSTSLCDVLKNSDRNPYTNTTAFFNFNCKKHWGCLRQPLMLFFRLKTLLASFHALNVAAVGLCNVARNRHKLFMDDINDTVSLGEELCIKLVARSDPVA